ncbi:hypothetical protein BU17DRAFT_82400 [Hysterangium stoloniferum]|nr:hypothetical protein BU17DRAFT_82400 [Hysterangium stoloniferum]
MSSPIPLPALPAFDNTVGAELIGVLVSVLLYGISLVQVYIYFQTFPDDSKNLKILVTMLCLLTTVAAVLTCNGLYYYVVTNFANPQAMLYDYWSWVYEPFFQIIISLTVETFFALRVYTCESPANRERARAKATVTSEWKKEDLFHPHSRTRHHRQRYQAMSVPVILFEIPCSLTLSTTVAIVQVIKHPFTGQNPGKIQQIPSCISLGATAACDFAIASIQTYYLQRGRTGIRKTDQMINILIMYTVSSGTLTTVAAIFGLVFYAIMPNNTIFWAFTSISCGSYTNALLASLNGRRNLRSTMASTNGRNVALSSMGLANGLSPIRIGPRRSCDSTTVNDGVISYTPTDKENTKEEV